MAHEETRCLVALRGVSRRFGSVQALSEVDFELLPGEIHALLGENGAGKSTLLSTLAGMVRPDEGQVVIEGAVRDAWGPAEARAAGLGMVHQHFVQSDRHTALENIALGWEGLGALPRWGQARAAVDEVAKRHGIPVDLDRPVRELPVGERQKIEVVRALFLGARVLLLDEPTAVLTNSEAGALLSALRRFKEGGGAVVFTSHKLDEVLRVSDRVTVLRKGRVLGTFDRGELSADELATLMVGRPISRAVPTSEIHVGTEVLSLRGVTVRDARGRPELMNANLRLAAGQVLGIAGVAGSGQLALAELVAGLRQPSAGKVKLFGQTVTRFSASGFARLGVAYIPEDRNRTGAVGSLSVLENLILRMREFTRAGVVDWERARVWAQGRVEEYGIDTPGLDTPAAVLSGGNLQKVILARELSGRPELIVAAYPTRGLDMAAAEAVRERLLRARWSGGAVVLISEDLDELFRMSDQIAVLYGGRVIGVASRAEASRDRIGLWMGGHGQNTQAELSLFSAVVDTEGPP